MTSVQSGITVDASLKQALQDHEKSLVAALDSSQGKSSPQFQGIGNGDIKNGNSGQGLVILKLEIVNETIQITKTLQVDKVIGLNGGNGPSSITGQQLAQELQLDTICYLLHLRAKPSNLDAHGSIHENKIYNRFGSSGSSSPTGAIKGSSVVWDIVLWVPSAGVAHFNSNGNGNGNGIRDRMKYASSKSQVLQAIGYNKIGNNGQASNLEELGEYISIKSNVPTQHSNTSSSQLSTSYRNTGMNVRPILAADRIVRTERNTESAEDEKKDDPRNAMSTKELEKLALLENEDRAREEIINREFIERMKRQSNKHNEAAVTGGFVRVELPLAEETKQRLTEMRTAATSSIQQGNYGWIELEIVNRKQVCIKRVGYDAGAIGQDNEPRYVVVQGRVFVMYIPENSRAQLRMVYSTGADSVMRQVEQIMGVVFVQKLEIFSKTEMKQEEIIKRAGLGAGREMGGMGMGMGAGVGGVGAGVGVGASMGGTARMNKLERVLSYRSPEPARSVPKRFNFAAQQQKSQTAQLIENRYKEENSFNELPKPPRRQK